MFTGYLQIFFSSELQNYKAYSLRLDVKLVWTTWNFEVSKKHNFVKLNEYLQGLFEALIQI
jgi:hypothetical protein